MCFLISSSFVEKEVSAEDPEPIEDEATPNENSLPLAPDIFSDQEEILEDAPEDDGEEKDPSQESEPQPNTDSEEKQEDDETKTD